MFCANIFNIFVGRSCWTPTLLFDDFLMSFFVCSEADCGLLHEVVDLSSFLRGYIVSGALLVLFELDLDWI